MFCEANGYEASFAYSLKNDEQIAAAQKFIQDGVDYLLLSQPIHQAGTVFLRMHRMQESRLSFSTVPSMQATAFMRHQSFPIWTKKARPQLTG